MEKIKVMIVEDMEMIAEDIAARLKKHNLEVCGMYNTGEDAIKSLDRIMPDLILMDIQLAGALDGISTAKIIVDQYPVPIIYLSDFVDDVTVARAGKTRPANYLAKPFNEGDLVRAINIAFWNASDSGMSAGTLKNHIFIKTENGYLKLAYDDILYLEASGAYCRIFTVEKSYLQSISMNHVLDQLSHKDFVRIHRSHAINLNKVNGIEGNMLTVGPYRVEMSKSMREELLGRLNFLK